MLRERLGGSTRAVKVAPADDAVRSSDKFTTYVLPEFNTPAVNPPPGLDATVVYVLTVPLLSNSVNVIVPF